MKGEKIRFKKPTTPEELEVMRENARKAREKKLANPKPVSEKRLVICVSLKPREHEYLKRLGKGRASDGVKMLLPLYLQKDVPKINKREKTLGLRKVNIKNEDLL